MQAIKPTSTTASRSLDIKELTKHVQQTPNSDSGPTDSSSLPSKANWINVDAKQSVLTAGFNESSSHSRNKKLTGKQRKRIKEAQNQHMTLTQLNKQQLHSLPEGGHQQSSAFNPQRHSPQFSATIMQQIQYANSMIKSNDYNPSTFSTTTNLNSLENAQINAGTGSLSHVSSSGDHLQQQQQLHQRTHRYQHGNRSGPAHLPRTDQMPTMADIQASNGACMFFF